MIAIKQDFCTHCGAQAQLDQSFCTECGIAIEAAAGNGQQTVEFPTPERETASPKPMTLKKKVTLISSAAILIFLLGTHITLKTLTSPEKKMEALYNALLIGDDQAFFNELDIPEHVTYIPEAYLAFLKNQENMPLFLDYLKELASATAKDGVTRMAAHDHDGDVLRIVQKKMFGLYPTVSVEPITVHATIETDLPEGTLSIAGKKVEFQGKDIDLGVFLPGSYKVEVESKNPYLPNKATWDIQLSAEQGEHAFSFRKSDHMVVIDSDFQDSVVHVNGTSTKKNGKGTE